MSDVSQPKGVVGLVVLLVGVVSTVGCRQEPQNSPEAAYRSFIDAVQRGNTRKAWAALSPATRQKVAERSKAISEASKGVVRDEPEQLLFQGTRPGPVGAVSELKAEEGSALLSVAGASGPREVKLVREFDESGKPGKPGKPGKWLIDLSDTIPKRDAP